jgi:hypothetical protein
MPRQFKATDTSQWAEQFGTGKDGAINITEAGTRDFKVASSPFTTDANSFASFTGTSGNSSGSATDVWGFHPIYTFIGDYVLIHQTQGTNVGNWELNVITGGIPASGGTSTLTLKYPLQNTYTTGCQIIKCPQFSSFTLGASTSLTQSYWQGTWGGIVAFFCNGTTTLNGLLSVNERGSRGGFGRDFGSTAFTGENENNTGLQQTSASYNGGGGSDGDNGDGRGASGGGGGNYTVGSAGSTEGGGAVGGSGGAVAQTNTELTVNVFGGGGGGGSRTGSGAYPAGGAGGGLIFIFTKDLQVNNQILSNGGLGQTSGDGGGGGGAGGCVLIKTITATLGSNQINALGNTGGIRGGTGGNGRIHLDYASSYTGTTSPTLSATQDSSLYPAGGAFIYNLL